MAVLQHRQSNQMLVEIFNCEAISYPPYSPNIPIITFSIRSVVALHHMNVPKLEEFLRRGIVMRQKDRKKQCLVIDTTLNETLCTGL